MSEFKDKKSVFNRNKHQEVKTQSSGPAGKTNISATHLVELQKAAKAMPRMNKKQKKG